MPKFQFHPVRASAIILILFSLGFSIYSFSYAWVEPNQTPPSGNIAAPLHTGTTSQTKQGFLTAYGVEGYYPGNGAYGVLGYEGWGGYFNGGVYTNSSLIAMGNVGIGTANPSTRFETYGIIRATGNAADYGGWGTGPWAVEIGRDNTYGYVGSYERSTSTYKPLYLFASKIILNGGTEGNVGIGTASPGSKLDVRGGYIRTADNAGSSDAAFMQGSTGNVYFGSLGTSAIRIGNGSGWSKLVIANDGGISAQDFYSYSAGVWMSQLVPKTATGRASFGLPMTWTDRTAITGDTRYWTGSQGWGRTDFNSLQDYGSTFFDTWSDPGNEPPGTSHWQGLQAYHFNGGGGYVYGSQLAFGSPMMNGSMFMRSAWGGGWSAWVGVCMANGTNCPIASTNADTVDGYHVSVAGSANTLPTRNGSGYLTPESWTQLNGYYGLYSPNNGAHFYPNPGSYGSWKVIGSRNGWYGLEFDTVAGQTSLMVGTTGQGWGSQITGFHNNSYGWLWRFDHSTLVVGDVPIARIPDIGSASVNYATYGRNVYDNGAYSGSAAWREPSSMHVYYSYYGRLVYNNGAYSGLGWTEPSDLGVRYANTAGSAGSLYNIGGFYAIPSGTTVLNVVYAYQYNCMSDINLKKDIKAIDSALDKIVSIKGVSFKWKDENMGAGKQVGVIAQDVEKVLPEVVTTNEQGLKAVDYSKLTPLIIEAVKDLKIEKDGEVRELKDQIEELNKRIQILEERE